MNMKILLKSRKRQTPGDVFVYQLQDRPYGFGRVVRTDAHIGGFRDVLLIYIYDAFSECKHEIPRLDRDHLLVPPIGTNRQPWLKGYFETVAHEALTVHDVLRCHCFASLARPGVYCDDDGRELRKRSEPCGVDALDSYRTIDDGISKALGIPLAPD